MNIAHSEVFLLPSSTQAPNSYSKYYRRTISVSSRSDCRLQ